MPRGCWRRPRTRSSTATLTSSRSPSRIRCGRTRSSVCGTEGKDYVDSIDRELRFRLWSTNGLVNGIRERLEPEGALFAWPPKFRCRHRSTSAIRRFLVWPSSPVTSPCWPTCPSGNRGSRRKPSARSRGRCCSLTYREDGSLPGRPGTGGDRPQRGRVPELAAGRGFGGRAPRAAHLRRLQAAQGYLLAAAGLATQARVDDTAFRATTRTYESTCRSRTVSTHRRSRPRGGTCSARASPTTPAIGPSRNWQSSTQRRSRISCGCSTTLRARHPSSAFRRSSADLRSISPNDMG